MHESIGSSDGTEIASNGLGVVTKVEDPLKLSPGGNMRQKALLAAALVALLLVGAPTALLANLVTNGSFETSDFTGWNHTGLTK